MNLNSPVSSLPLVGPTYVQRLKKLNIETIDDLLHHYPTRYWDLSKITNIAEVADQEEVTIRGEIISGRNLYLRNRLSRQNLIIADKTGQISVTWFNQPYLIKSLNPGIKVNLAGKVTTFNNQFTLTSPQYEVVHDKALHTGRLVPIYKETAGISSKWLRSKIASILKNAKEDLNKDWLPKVICQKYHLIDLASALPQIHFPKNNQQIRKATERLAFNEMFLLKLKALVSRQLFKKQPLVKRLSVDQEKVLGLIKSLPFSLTKAQNEALQQILDDLSKNKPMNRLLQGDVGSGKTVVAAVAIYVTFLNGLQTALLAPTEILARQHFDTLSIVFNKLGLNIKLVTGQTKKGDLTADVYVGTHALLYRKIDLSSLGLLVIDEQQRFGVNQRTKLLDKNAYTPHLLSMTATPIPRTIALTFFANLDLSIIDQLPPGRQEIKTWVVPNIKRLSAYQWIEKQIKKNHSQAFIVCPLIDPSGNETLKDVRSVTDEFVKLEKIFSSLKLGLLHGRLKSNQKQAVLAKFAQRKKDILVTTPVIEVGIDIPQATIMMVENADRFGLAQLHQLRGRVGRNKKKAYCLLFSHQPDDSLAVKRLKNLEIVKSGLKLAEIDLRLRGPGSLLGTAQHGFFNWKLASLNDAQLLSQTDQAAQLVIKQLTPALNQQLKTVRISTSFLN